MAPGRREARRHMGQRRRCIQGRRSLEQLEGRGLRVVASIVDEPQRRAFTLVDDTGERTITVIGEKLRPSGDDGAMPWEELRRCDCVYFTGGDVQALRNEIDVVGKHTILEAAEDATRGGRIMGGFPGAGFYHNAWGYLPWTWGRDPINRFEVWRVD